VAEGQPATRRAPYDVENPVQYNLVDQFRNDAYGLPGWNEGGGPAGRLRLFRESRYVGKLNFDWQLDRNNRLRAGGEATRYSIGRYESELATLGDAYLEHPERWNLFAENRLDLGDVVLIAGLRYDRYASRASRPFLLDTVARSPTFGRYVNIAGASIYDRIMILPTSVAPRNPPPAVAGTAPGIIRPVAPRQADDPNANDDADAAQGNDGVPLGRPVPIPRPVVGGAPVAVPGNPPIVPPVAVVPDGEPQPPPPLVVTPANPFGLPAGSSQRPGVIAPPPAAQPPRPPDQD